MAERDDCPFLAHEADHPRHERQNDDRREDPRRGERPSEEEVPRRRGRNDHHQRRAPEHYHGEVVRIARTRHHAVTDGQQERYRAEVIRHSDGCGDAGELAQYEHAARDRFGNHRQRRLVVDLPRQDARSAERSHQQPGYQQRGQTEVLQHLLVARAVIGADVQRPSRQRDRKHEYRERHDDQYAEDRLAYALNERVLQYRPELHHFELFGPVAPGGCEIHTPMIDRRLPGIILDFALSMQSAEGFYTRLHR